MARVGMITKIISKTLRISYRQQQDMASWTALHESKLVKQLNESTKQKEFVKNEGGRERGESYSWVPHSRTGIYYPKGHEWVMDDIPKGAASFGETAFWFRNIDGVDKPDPADDK